jgi:ribosomal protein S18 acetylase RimI-like enzyme
MEAVCDVAEPWEHGIVFRASRYPSYYDFNVVWVEGAPEIGAEALIAAADEGLAGLEHRRLDFELAEAAERVRVDLEAAHWEPTRLLWMRHEAPLPPGPALEVEEVDYDAVLELRLAWHREDFPNLDSRGYLANAREVATAREVQVIATREGGELVGFAQLERSDRGAEVSQVYVRPEHRGSGRGTAITRAAIEAAGDVDDLWIVADDEGRPKHLYARLGFEPEWTAIQATRLP